MCVAIETASNGPHPSDVTVASEVNILSFRGLWPVRRRRNRSRSNGRHQPANQTRGRQAIKLYV